MDGGTLLIAQLFVALRYKLESRGFDSRWCRWNFSLTLSFRPHYGPGIDSTSNTNEYQEYFLGGKRRPVHMADNLTTFMCRLCRNLGATASWNPQSLSRPVMRFLYLYLITGCNILFIDSECGSRSPVCGGIVADTVLLQSSRVLHCTVFINHVNGIHLLSSQQILT